MASKIVVASGRELEINDIKIGLYFDDLDEVLAEKNAVSILPERTKFCWRDMGYYRYVIQDEPQIRSVMFFGKTFQIAVPYVIYVTGYRFCAYFKSKPIETLNDRLTPAIFSNVSWNGEVCLNDIGKNENIISAFWRTNFNSSMTNNNWADRRHVFGPNFYSFEAWEQASRLDPSFILRMDWENNEISTTLSQLSLLPRRIKTDFSFGEYYDIMTCLQDRRS